MGLIFMSVWLKVAGVSGFLSVGAAAFGKHSLPEQAETRKSLQHRKDLWETGNRLHMFHSLALLGVPLIRNPFCHLAGALCTLGIAGFSGSMYSKAYYGDAVIPPAITQAGGGMLGLGWLFFFFPRL